MNPSFNIKKMSSSRPNLILFISVHKGQIDLKITFMNKYFLEDLK